ncbi:MAG: hypothetical protein J6Z45_03465 [Oscillospiraceae bacterium]|nr:hypothetical protein [Oscillospiraceae bacterium]
MKQLLPLLLTAAALLTLLLFGGCAEGSSTDSGGEPFTVEDVTAEESSTTTETTHSSLVFTTAASTESSETVTTTTTKPTVVGLWVLDSTVTNGQVQEVDTSEEPPIAYRYVLQYDFAKNGKVSRIHPLYGYREEGTWSYGETGISRVILTFPYHHLFNPLEQPEELAFENGTLFSMEWPEGTDRYFKRVQELPEADPVRAADGKTRLAVSGYWECAWVNTGETQYTDQYQGVDVKSMKMEISLGGTCILHRNSSPEEYAAYSLIFLSDNSMELRLLRSKSTLSTIGQLEGTVQIKNGYLVWRYSDTVSYCFRSVTKEQFLNSLTGAVTVPEGN